jgi:hypothetical protein
VSGHLARREKTAKLQIAGYGLHPGKPDGFLHGVVGRGVCRVLVLWPK